MSKKNKSRETPAQGTGEVAGAAAPQQKNEKCFLIKRLSIRDWQRIDVEIEGDRIVKRTEYEPDLAPIVWYKTFLAIRGE